MEDRARHSRWHAVGIVTVLDLRQLIGRIGSPAPDWVVGLIPSQVGAKSDWPNARPCQDQMHSTPAVCAISGSRVIRGRSSAAAVAAIKRSPRSGMS